MKRLQVRKQSLADRVIALIEGARRRVAYTANLAQVYANYEIGRQIVEEEQGGKRRAGYGEKIIQELSAKLTARYGKGWGDRCLRNIRKFYLEYSTDEIRKELVSKSEKHQIFARRYSAIIPPKESLERIVLEEQRKFAQEKLLALAAARQKATHSKGRTAK